MRRLRFDGFRSLRWCIPSCAVLLYPFTDVGTNGALFCETARELGRDWLGREMPNIRSPSQFNGQRLFISENINLSTLGTRGRGWVCHEKQIESKSVLLSVPRVMVLDASNIESDPEFVNVVGPLRSAGLDDRGVLALWYLMERNKPRPAWEWYLPLLPSRYDLLQTHPLLSDEQVPGTSVGITARKMSDNISRQLRSVLASLKQLDPTNPILSIDKKTLHEEWRLCHTLVLTRSGLFDNVPDEGTWTDHLTILPGIDLVNHSDNPNAELLRCADGAVQLVATRDIDPGEEITISYWATQGQESMSLEQVLFTFGFTGGANRFSLPMISFDYADTDKRRAVQRLVYVDSKSSDQAKDEIYTDDVDSAVTYFAIECMSEGALSDLTKMIIEEGGVRHRSNAIIGAFRPAGRDRLRSEISTWKSKVTSVTISHPTLLEYQHMLTQALDALLREVS